jgi:hypothetical protein
MGGASSLLLERSRKEVVAEEGGKGMVKARGGGERESGAPKTEKEQQKKS